MSALFNLIPAWDCASTAEKAAQDICKKRASIITEIAKLLCLLQRLPMHRSERTFCQNVRKLITRPHVIDQIGLILVLSNTQSKSTLCVLPRRYKYSSSPSSTCANPNRLCVVVFLCVCVTCLRLRPLVALLLNCFQNCGVGLSENCRDFFYKHRQLN